MTVNLNPASTWDFAVMLGDETVSVREPTAGEILDMLDFGSLSDTEKVNKIRGVFSSLTGLSGDVVTLDQLFVLFQALVDYIVARRQPAQTTPGVIGSDRFWLLN